MAFLNFSHLQNALICPDSGSELHFENEKIFDLTGEQRGFFFDGAAVFPSNLLPEDFYNPEYTSSNGYSAESLRLIEEQKDGMILDLGAGLASIDYPNVVQLEIRKYRGTDVVLAGQKLPFRDNTFDGVISQAVIEHVRDPALHVNEIRRVLKPGAKVVLDAAFLQPLHGAPYHYFNTTHFAVLELFSEFDVEQVEVASYLHPWFALRWMLQRYEAGLLTESARDEFRNLTVQEVLNRGALMDAAAEAVRGESIERPKEVAEWIENMNQSKADVLGCLGKLSRESEKELAAGFRVLARKELVPKAISEKPSLGEKREIRTDMLRVQQNDGSTHTGELFGEHVVLQSFVCRDALSRIDIMFATFMRQNTKDVILRLSEDERGERILAEVSVNAALLRDNEFHEFRFPSVRSNNSGKYFLTLFSPESTLSDCVTVRAGGRKSLPDAELWIDGQKVDRDLTLRVYTHIEVRW